MGKGQACSHSKIIEWFYWLEEGTFRKKAFEFNISRREANKLLLPFTGKNEFWLMMHEISTCAAEHYITLLNALPPIIVKFAYVEFCFAVTVMRA
jgi:hypothetical protein